MTRPHSAHTDWRAIGVRVSDDLYAALQADADANGRTVTQSVRFLLQQMLTPGSARPTTEEADR